MLNPIIPDAKNAGYVKSLFPNGTFSISEVYANPATKM
jgi:hypothetical protein